MIYHNFKIFKKDMISTNSSHRARSRITVEDQHEAKLVISAEYPPNLRRSIIIFLGGIDYQKILLNNE